MQQQVRKNAHSDNAEAGRSRRLFVWCLGAVVAATALAAFWPATDGEFLNWDDDRNFLDNSDFGGVGTEQLGWAWRTYHLGVWQPLSWVLLGVQHRIGGLDPRTYHAFSVGLHALNTLVFFIAVLVILRAAEAGTGATVASAREGECAVPGESRLRGVGWSRYCAAALAALLFAVHPLRVEAVAWASCQPYLPAVLFYLLAVIAYVWAYGAPAAARSRGWIAWTAALVLYMAALASKAVAITLPVILLILDFYPLRRHLAAGRICVRQVLRIVLEKAPFVLVAAIAAIWAVEAKDAAQPGRPESIDWNANLAQSAYGLVFYLVKTVAPFDLAAYYRLPEGLGLSQWPYIGAAALVVGLSAGLVLLRRRFPAPLAAWAAYVVILLPNLGLVQISQQIAADRYSYLAIMPVMILLAGGLRRLLGGHGAAAAGRQMAVVAGCAVGAIAFATAARRHLATWADSVSLWEANLAVDPQCAHSECMLGEALAERGEFERAAEHLRRALELRPGFSFARANLGTLLLLESRFAEAAGEFERALGDEDPLDDAGLAKIHAQLAICYHEMGQEAPAWRHLRQAQKLGYPREKIIQLMMAFESSPD